MQTCPDCTAIKLQAADDPRFEIIDIGEHVRNLKQFRTGRRQNNFLIGGSKPYSRQCNNRRSRNSLFL